MGSRTVRNFGRRSDGLPVPDLTKIQRENYTTFLQKGINPDDRNNSGLEALFKEVFPIVSYDKTMELHYVSYELERPRYTPMECKQLRLTYGYPLKVRCRLSKHEGSEVAEQAIYLGEMPVMLGGGEFIINGAERVIVNQLHRSPGVDFVVESKEGDRVLHGGRIIPERGSWIEISVTKKDNLIVRIDQSSKIPATIFLRAMCEEYGSVENVLRLFYKTSMVDVTKLTPTMWSVGSIVDTETGEIIVEAGTQIGDRIGQIQASSLETVEVIKKVKDPIVLNTLAEDECESHEHALLKIYSRLRPGNPPNVEKAKQLFHEKFYDDNRYRLGKVGRFRVNRKFGQDISEDVMTLRPEDFLNSMRYIIGLRNNQGMVDDIDHLGNRRLRTVDELASDEIRKGLLKLRRTVQERMSMKDPATITRIADLVNSKSVSSSIEFFFGRGELSQVVDQTNSLSQLTHERRLSALGPGGLNRKRAGFEVRDVHISHYGRICPIETPEGTNIGLITSLGIYASIDEYGFLQTPYKKVVDGQVSGEIVTLRADEEMKYTFSPPSNLDSETGKLKDGLLIARQHGELSQVEADEIDFVDISSMQTVGVSASLIPFLDHDDANRALMGSNMMRQSVPLLVHENPIVGTGMEGPCALNSSMVICAEDEGTVTEVDSKRIVINGSDEYELQKYRGLNERTCLNQKPIIKLGDKVVKGQPLTEGGGTADGKLALGKNLMVAFVPFDGYNFEDAILINEKLVKKDTFTSIHIDVFSVEVRETKLGREEFTRDIPNVSEKMLRNLDAGGIVREGTRVGPGDILVGKVSPKSKTELTPEEKLLHAIFGRAGEDVKNDSLTMPSGYEGVVTGMKHFKRRGALSDAEKASLKLELEQFEVEMDSKQCDIFRKMMEKMHDDIDELTCVDPTTRQRVGASTSDDVVLEQIETFNLTWVKPSGCRKRAGEIYNKFWPKIIEVQEETKRRIDRMKRGDELPSGVLEMVKIYVANKRTLSVGDKMAGRHGNKGVISRILPEEDMPFLEDGTQVDIVLNPLGVPSRMNVGQLLETHLGWAASVLGFDAVTPVFDGASWEDILGATQEANNHIQSRIDDLEERKEAPPVEEKFAQVPADPDKSELLLKAQLYDGRTGEPFEQRATVGYMYMLKLHHLVDDKIHARSTGPYSLITQQPLGGKARTGGQRFGEMEVWALEGYGAAYTLQELLTVKSDDIEGRTKIYESMVKGNNTLEAGTPISFDVLCNEIRGLGLNIHLEKKRLGKKPL